MLLNYHIGRFVLVSLCVGDLVLLGLSIITPIGGRPVHRLREDGTATYRV